MSLRIDVAPTQEDAARRALDHIRACGESAAGARGRFVLSLAGGSTPKLIYRRWAELPGQPWNKLHLLFGDERCVPPEHPDSNFRMVEECLLARLAERPAVYRMQGEADPARAAEHYEQTLRQVLGADGRIDLALLGIGGDGHTASLFPGRPALAEAQRWVVDTLAPDGETRRISLSVPALKAARELAFVVTGADKAAILRQVLHGEVDAPRLPAQFFLRDETLAVTLFADQAAAAALNH